MLRLQRVLIPNLGHRQRKGRGMLEVMASILEVCLERTKKTHIMYKANMSSDSLANYIELLTKHGMLEKLDGYRTTEKGRVYLEHFMAIKSLLGEGGVASKSPSASYTD